MQRFITLCIIFIFLAQPLAVFAIQSSETFFIDSSFDALARSSVNTTLRYTGENAYFFVENGFYDSLSGNSLVDFSVSVRSLSEEFDTVIYPRLRDFLGPEWSPGIDNDEKITILFIPMKNGASGYVRLEDENLRSVSPDSNEREMIYLSSDTVGTSLAKSYLAHEFQHLINFYQNEKLQGSAEAAWLNEAFSEYMPSLLGYNETWQGSYLARRVQDFLSLPPDSLIHWAGTPSDFASVSLFIHYLADSFGEEILQSIFASEARGINAVDNALASHEADFESVFSDFAIANYINNITPEDGDRFTYKRPILFYGNLHTSPRATFNMIAGRGSRGTFAIRDWQADYYKIQPAVLGPTGKNVLEITFNGENQNTRFVIAYLAADFSGRYTVRSLTLDSAQDATITVPEFGTGVSSVTLMVSSQFDRASLDRLFKQFSIEVQLLEESLPLYSDGSLLRAAGDTKVYVIKDNYKRWIQSAEIFNGYGHLKWGDIIEVPPAVLREYQESFLIREQGDPRVYEVDTLGVKRWLNMTAVQFEASGRT